MLARLVVIIFGLCVAPTFGQAVAEINREYGNPTYSYSVSQHIWMTPDYAVNRQVCRMRLYPKHIGPKTDYLSPRLSFEELTAVLNKLVPLSLRGQKKDSFGLSDFGGVAGWTTYEYEKVTFVFTFPLGIDSSYKHKSDSVSVPIDEVLARISKDKSPSIDDFMPSQFSETEIVTILWNDRKCSP